VAKQSNTPRVPFTEFLIKMREFDKAKTPDLDSIKESELCERVRVSRSVALWTILNRHTNEVHSHRLELRTFRYLQNGWKQDDNYCISLSDEGGIDEIQRLFDFLASLPNVNASGNYVVMNTANLDQRLSLMLDAVSTSENNLQLLSQIMSWASSDVRAHQGLVKLSSDDPDRSKALVAALNYGRYVQSINQLKRMVQQSLNERHFQAFLEENYWMFGSEYSELIDKRSLVLGMQLDFPLRRTVDGYLDIIEIKTPFDGKPLFETDKDHDNLYAGKELSKVMSQARKYLDMLAGDQYRIELQNKLKVDKVRAKVVIGRDGDEAQIKALRTLNADSNKLEVITFDQLIRIAQRILDIMADENPFLKELAISPNTLTQSGDDAFEYPIDDIPF
jgi:hypothetical protein